MPELKAVLFDVDFTLVKPGPDLGPEGYVRVGRRYGLTIDPTRYEQARDAAFGHLEAHPELDHDETIWFAFTERIIRGMGGDGDGAYAAAVEITKSWEHAHNFDLYEDALPVLDELRRHGLKIGLVSNSARDMDEFAAHHGLDVDAAITSFEHGKTKPHETIFLAICERLGVAPDEAAMVGDSPADDIDGARALGMRAFLVDREGRHPEASDRLPTLLALPAALGLGPLP